MDKKEALRIHARNRAKERYGISYNRHDRRNIIDMIEKNDIEVIFVKKESKRVSVYYVRYKDQDLKIVYDRNRMEIVTFLTPDANERQECAIKKVISKRR
jgi:hypothetical protein